MSYITGVSRFRDGGVNSRSAEHAGSEIGFILNDQIRTDSLLNAISTGSWTRFRTKAPMAAITAAAIQAMMKLRIADARLAS
jgi:hypothetical protein